MKNPVNIAHPLKSRSATSQSSRRIGALETSFAPIDGKTLADRLYLISTYARQLNFYEYHRNDRESEYQDISNWSPFFSESLPFQLAVFSKTSVEDLEQQFLTLQKELLTNPSRQSLESLLGFIYDKLIEPTTGLYQSVDMAANSFSVSLLAIITTSFKEPLKCFIALYNASVAYLCVCKREFSDLSLAPWDLKAEDIYARDSCIQRVKKGKKAAILVAGETATTIFYQMLSGFDNIVVASPGYISESLIPLEAALQKKHRPHLALLFTFLELFKYFQGNLNELGKKHLDFFYKKVLRLNPKAAVPDKAHIIFEMAKHLDAYPLRKDLLLKDDKDSKNQDIQFGLDQELVLDKAQVKELRTLSLNYEGEKDKKYIEGVYISPVANSIDGKGQPFKEGSFSNWTTLGSKYSKLIPEGNGPAVEHPKARIGFVLASPVLLLEEGKRTITFWLNCNMAANSAVTLNAIKHHLDLLKSQQNYLLDQSVIDLCASIFSDKAKNYLDGLLHKENPYTIYDLKEFLTKGDPISCEPFLGKEERKAMCECLKELSLYCLDKGIIDACAATFSAKAINFLNNLIRTAKTYVIRDLEKFLLSKDSKDNSLIFSNTEKASLQTCIVNNAGKYAKRLFKISFSGENGWVQPKQGNIVRLEIYSASFPGPITDGDLQFEIQVELDDDDPKVVFYDETVLEEKLPLEKSFPLVKIELDPEIMIRINPFECDHLLTPPPIESPPCCLEIATNPGAEMYISPYHFLKGLTLADAKIEVQVCGVKNLIVQNDENLQDVNKPIMPFGPRPKVGEKWFVDAGANFYIGSKEIFCKNWQKFWINTTWKDKPNDLHEHYRFYRDPKFENEDDAITKFSFRFKTSILNEGNWIQDKINVNIPPPPVLLIPPTAGNYSATYIDKELLPLFFSVQKEPNQCVKPSGDNSFCHNINLGFFIPAGFSYTPKSMPLDPLAPLTVNTLKGFAKITLAGASFQHDRFTYVLTRQMMALAKLVDPQSVAEAIKELERIEKLCLESGIRIDDIKAWANTLNDLKNEVGKSPPPPPFTPTNIPDDIPINLNPWGLEKIDESICGRVLKIKNDKFNPSTKLGLPKEPYTPIIKSLSIDYFATADALDMDIIHLYPFEQTSKLEDIEQHPTLFPYFDEEGSLYIGIENCTPGSNLSLLFQLAEATADSELDRAKIKWHYLGGNRWTELQPNFDIISDETDGFTESGIVTISVPDAITKKGNTLMPDGLYWIKASAASNVRAVAETIGIHTQAAKASARLAALNDTGRLDTALKAESISKLAEGDFSVKKVVQPYASFDGRRPEEQGHFYVRVSEHLKHKGRGITLQDYEKIVLEAFPQIYKVKCISHTMGLSAKQYRRDLEVAPGFLVVAVIPDLTKLLSGSQLEPKVPLSLLEKIGDYLRKRMGTFARLKVMNPRYEYVDVTISVRLYRGKPSSYYAKELKKDITNFLAPWYLGDSEKLSFGQEVLFSDIVGFVERLDYVDFIVNLELEGECVQKEFSVIKPLTARSVLTGGKICVVIDEEVCLELKPGMEVLNVK